MIDRLRERVVRWLTQRVFWVGRQVTALSGEMTGIRPLVTIVGREHYAESRRKYPIRSWRELAAAVALELRGKSTSLAFIGPWSEGHREVAIFEISSSFSGDGARAFFWIPESLLISSHLGPSNIADIDRDGLRYFCSQNSASQLSGGVIRSPEIYAASAGVSSSAAIVRLDRELLAEIFLKELPCLSFEYWFRALRPGFASELIDWLRPAAIVAAVTSLIYLVAISLVLTGTTLWRERQLRGMGSDVGALLSLQRKIDAGEREVTLMADVLAAKPQTFRAWQLASIVWVSGGVLTNMVIADREITIRGSVPVATDLLSSLSKLDGFESAKFGSPVRQNGSREEFTIIIRLKEIGHGTQR